MRGTLAAFMMIRLALAIQAPVPTRETVFLVTRASSAEARAMLSARLVQMHGTKLHWYSENGVVRVEIDKETITKLEADPEVVVVVGDVRQESPAITLETPPTLPAQPLLTPPSAMSCPVPSAFGAMQLPGMGVGMTPGMGMNMGTGMGMQGGMGMMGLMDSVAGGVAAHIFNRPPSCKIQIGGKGLDSFASGGGDGVLTVEASGTCSWQAQSTVPWIKIISGSGVSGSGVVSYTVNPSEGKLRTGSITIVPTVSGSPIKGKASLVLKQNK